MRSRLGTKQTEDAFLQNGQAWSQTLSAAATPALQPDGCGPVREDTVEDNYFLGATDGATGSKAGFGRSLPCVNAVNLWQNTSRVT